MIRIAIQGELGSFHHTAALKWFGNDSTIVACESFGRVFSALDDKQADVAVVAIENSLYGSITEVYDLLLSHSIPIIGEIPERIHQCLIGKPGTTLGDITSVYSHPVALAQCEQFLDDKLPYAERIESHDTAGSVAYIMSQNSSTSAAIAGSLAADIYGATVLERTIENFDSNYTRFLVLQPGAQPPHNSNKASLVIRTNHQPGALYKALGVFADSGINLTKLQSRPIPGKIWKYLFYIDVEADAQQLHEACATLKLQDCDVTVLGQYVAAKLKIV